MHSCHVAAQGCSRLAGLHAGRLLLAVQLLHSLQRRLCCPCIAGGRARQGCWLLEQLSVGLHLPQGWPVSLAASFASAGHPQLAGQHARRCTKMHVSATAAVRSGAHSCHVTEGAAGMLAWRTHLQGSVQVPRRLPQVVQGAVHAPALVLPGLCACAAGTSWTCAARPACSACQGPRSGLTLQAQGRVHGRASPAAGRDRGPCSTAPACLLMADMMSLACPDSLMPAADSCHTRFQVSLAPS